MNILFLDDEQMVLDALRRSLRAKQSEWSMRFAATVEECWSLLESESFDVVVTDAQLPGASGATFIAELQERLPQTVRIMLSGFKDQHSVSTIGAHRFLMKPILATNLIRQISEATREELDDVSKVAVRGTIGLITPAETVAQLRAVLADGSVQNSDVAPIIRQDPALLAKILHTGNSGVFTRPGGIDVEACLSKIGIDGVRLLAERDDVLRSYAPGDPRDTAISQIVEQARSAAEDAAQQSDASDKECVYTATLLSCVGTLLRAEHENAGNTSLLADSTRLSVALLRLWGVPSSVVDAIASTTDA